MLLLIASRLIGFGSATQRTRTAGRWFVRAGVSFEMASFT
jgi:hypothetical protein